MAYCCCLLLRGYASAATGSQSPAELPLCTALRWRKYLPSSATDWKINGQGTGNCGCGFEPHATAFRQPPHVVSAIFTTDRIQRAQPANDLDACESRRKPGFSRCTYQGTASAVP